MPDREDIAAPAEPEKVVKEETQKGPVIPKDQQAAAVKKHIARNAPRPEDEEEPIDPGPPVSVDPVHKAEVGDDIEINALMLAHATVMLHNADKNHVFASMQLHIKPKGILVQAVFRGRVQHELVEWQAMHDAGLDASGLDTPDGNPLIAAIIKVRDDAMRAG